MGQSAGAAHAFTALTYPSLIKDPNTTVPAIRGLILLSGAYKFDSIPADSPLGAVLAQYHGSWEDAKKQSPIGLLQQGLKPRAVNVMAFIAEWDPEWMKLASDDFCRLLGLDVTVVLAERHNHISYIHALGTGEGEDWAVEVLKWMGKH